MKAREFEMRAASTTCTLSGSVQSGRWCGSTGRQERVQQFVGVGVQVQAPSSEYWRRGRGQQQLEQPQYCAAQAPDWAAYLGHGGTRVADADVLQDGSAAGRHRQRHTHAHKQRNSLGRCLAMVVWHPACCCCPQACLHAGRQADLLAAQPPPRQPAWLCSQGSRPCSCVPT